MDTTISTTYDSQELFKLLIDSQNNIYSNIIYVFIGITAVLIGINIVFNYINNRVLIKNEIKKLFNDEKKEYEEEINKRIKEMFEEELIRFSSEIDYLKGERARLFALACDKKESHNEHRIYWWSQALNFYIKCKRDKLISVATKALLNELKEYKECDLPKIEALKKVFQKSYDLNSLPKIVEKIPPILFIEKTELTEILERFSIK